MAKQKNVDRKARIEAMRREQQRKERLRTWGVLGVCGVVVVALLSVVAVKLVKQHQEDERIAGKPLAKMGVAASAASCSSPKTEDASGSGQHVTPPTVIDYATAPPAYGKHWGNYLSGSEIKTFYSRQDVPEIERLVHSLEHGHTILWYDDTVKQGSADYKAMQAMATKLGLDSYFMVAPYIKAKDGNHSFPAGKHVALTHWTGPDDQKGVWQYCARPSGSVVQDFVKKYPKTNAPEPGAA
ncbi:DUF3105 domain-containing protein [Nocardioides mangrovicus]|uniref:DUF3105 domain-containing protein n=1 Tax=Nocardioides mangrovicus TaxID=2478913 RepID=A0A3L8P649_9ACTN|nr:DUF3105 domain-containing protein [Nocardioides mangrovicus]RLV49908.1 DUF3105 domain-containing protein [Nocardioides mangrovicus]